MCDYFNFNFFQVNLFNNNICIINYFLFIIIKIFNNNLLIIKEEKCEQYLH